MEKTKKTIPPMVWEFVKIFEQMGNKINLVDENGNIIKREDEDGKNKDC